MEENVERAPVCTSAGWTTFKKGSEAIDTDIDFSSWGEIQSIGGSGIIVSEMYIYIHNLWLEITGARRRVEIQSQSESAHLTFPLVAHLMGTPWLWHDWSGIKASPIGEEGQKRRNIHRFKKCTRIRVSAFVSLRFGVIYFRHKGDASTCRRRSENKSLWAWQKKYTLPLKSLGSLRNVFIFQRKALFFQ